MVNDVYRSDKASRNNDDFGGSGLGSGRYDETEDRKERIREIKLPIILSAFFVLCLAILIYLSISDLVYYTNGSTITGTANSNANYASFTAPDGHNYTVAAPWSGLTSNQEVTIYYMNDQYTQAHIMTKASWWIAMYSFFIVVFAFMIMWIYRTLHRTRHAKVTEPIRNQFD